MVLVIMMTMKTMMIVLTMTMMMTTTMTMTIKPNTTSIINMVYTLIYHTCLPSKFDSSRSFTRTSSVKYS